MSAPGATSSAPEPSAMRSRARWLPNRSNLALSFILLLSAAIHIAFMVQLGETPFGELLMVDAQTYHDKALEILSKGWLSPISSYQAPLYPYFLAAIYSIAGVKPTAVGAVQCALSVANVLLIFLLGKRIFNARAGLIAAAIAAFYGAFVFFAGILLKESLTIFLASLMLLLLANAASSPRSWRYLAAGLCLGACIALRENFFIVLAALVPWAAASAPVRRMRLLAPLLLILGAALAIAPFAIKNAYYTRQALLTSSQAGANFYIGNNRAARGFYTRFDFVRPNPRFEEIDFHREAERASERKLTPAEVSRYWFKKSFDEMREDPLLFPRLTATRLGLLLNDYEIPDNYDFGFVRSIVPALRIAFIPYGAVMVLALFGIFLSGLRTPGARLIALFVAAHTISVVVFFVNDRFRIPAVPALIVFAAYAISDGWKNVVVGGRKRIALSIAALAILSVAVFTPYADEKNFSFSWFKIGNSYENAGRLDEAILYYSKALSVRPDFAKARIHTGIVYEKMGDPKRATVEYDKALSIDPKSTEALFCLAAAREKMGLEEGAMEAYRAIISMREETAEAHNNLGLIYSRRGMTDMALSEIRRAVELSPMDATFRNNLGVVYLAMGLREEAISSFSEALKIDPGHPGAIENMKNVPAEGK